MISRRILTISLFITAVSVYLYFFRHAAGFIWLVGAGLLVAMGTYVFQHQINWWWYERFPPSLPPAMQKMYMRFGAFYKSLDAGGQMKFNTRAMLFVEADEFIPQGIHELAEDIKFMIAYYAVMLSFHKEDYMFAPYQRIVIYLHPFLTPNMQDHVHTYELEHVDGTLIFSLEQLSAGFFSPQKYYQTGLHAFAELYASRYLRDQTISDPGAMWVILETISGWSKQRIEDFTGMQQSSPVPVMLHHWFTYPENMRKASMELYQKIEGWLR